MSEQQAMETGWKPGPLPPGTSGWGGIVTVKMVRSKSTGFRFADFRGDHVVCDHQRIEPDQVAFYNNSLTCPTYEEHAKPVMTGVLGLLLCVLQTFSALMVCGVLLGCSQTPPDMSGFASALVVTNQPTDLPNPDDDGCLDNDCNGTGVITHGDGHTSKCPCVRCECRKGGATPGASFMLPPHLRTQPSLKASTSPETSNPLTPDHPEPSTPDLEELASIPTPYVEAYQQALSKSRPMVVVMEGTSLDVLDTMTLPPGHILTTFPRDNPNGGYFKDEVTILYPRGGKMIKGSAGYRDQSGAKPQTRSR